MIYVVTLILVPYNTITCFIEENAKREERRDNIDQGDKKEQNYDKYT